MVQSREAVIEMETPRSERGQCGLAIEILTSNSAAMPTANIYKQTSLCHPTPARRSIPLVYGSHFLVCVARLLYDLAVRIYHHSSSDLAKHSLLSSDGYHGPSMAVVETP